MRYLLIGLILLASGCGAVAPGRGRDVPGLTCGAREYLDTGDIDAAERCLTDGLTRRPSARAAFLLGDLLDSTGRPEEALDQYFAALLLARKDSASAAAVTAAAMGVVAIRDRVSGFEERFGELMSRLDPDTTPLPPAAWYELLNLELALARRRADPGAEGTELERAGCLSRWRVSGPFGPFAWELFDGDRGAEANAPWPESVDLGPGRGPSAVRLIESSSCTIRTGDPAQVEGGVGRARTTLVSARRRTIAFRFETAAAARVSIGGAVVFQRDPRQGWPARINWFAVSVPAGNTEIRVELADPDRAPIFSLMALDDRGRSAAHGHDPESRGATSGAEVVPSEPPTRPVDAADAIARLRAALWYDDRTLIDRLLGALETEELPPTALALVAEALMTDPALPGEVAFERSRALMQKTLEQEPRLWRARLHLARYESMDDRDEAALALLEHGREITPDEPALLGRIADLTAGLGWHAEGAAAVDELTRRLPDSCQTAAWRLALARRENRFSDALERARDVVECSAGSEALAEELTRSQRFPEALAEYRRLARRHPDSAQLTLAVARAAAAAGERSVLIDAARRGLELDPGDDTVRRMLADALVAAGKTDEARALLREGLVLPGPRPGLESALAVLDGAPIYAELRVDGAATIDLYREQDPSYETPAVWVLDRAVHVIDHDGSRTELVHTIAHLTSDEAVERHGEFAVPPGALLLKLRTIKSDGRVLEPEEVAGKGTVSLPELEIGDFIEAEYATYYLPSPMFPGGFDTGRFYFQDFRTAFHRSEMLVIAPRNMNLQIDPRGASPKAERSEAGDLQSLVWRVDRVLPRAEEPRAPVATEYLPSIRVIAAGSERAVLLRLRELLATSRRPSRHLDEVAEQVLRGFDAEDHLARRRALYRWVVEEIDPGEDLFEEASHIVTRRSGSRIRALEALLRTAGYTPRLALVRAAGADESEPRAPSLDILDRAVLRVDDEWLSLDLDGAPYGYLGSELRGRPAVFVDDGAETITGEGSVARDRQVIELEVTVAPDGSAEGFAREELTGLLAAGWRSDLRRLPGNEIELRFQEGYLARTIPGAQLTSLEIGGAEDPEAPLVLRYEFTAPALARSGAGILELTLPFPVTLREQVGGLPVRRTPLVLASSVEKQLRATVRFPDGWRTTIDQLPTIESSWGRASREVRDGSATAVITLESRLEADRIEPERYPEFLEFSRSVDRLFALEIVSRQRVP